MLKTVKMRLAFLAMALALVGMVAAVPLESASAQPATAGTATITDALGNVLGTVSNLTATNNGAGNPLTITGTFTDTAGHVTNFTTTMLGATGTCPILNLTLGPLDLNLLGVMVHLNQVHLVITAQSGPGNLLGNLLCGVTHLLDSNGSTNAVANLLNHVFALL